MSYELDLSHIEPAATLSVPADYVLFPVNKEQADGSRIVSYLLLAVPTDDEINVVACKVVHGGGIITPDLGTGSYSLDITAVQGQLTPRDREIISYMQRDELACAAFGAYAMTAVMLAN